MDKRYVDCASMLKTICISGLLLFAMPPALAAQTMTNEQIDEMTRLYESEDYENMRRLLIPLAELGIPDAQYNLAVLFRDGLGGAQDTQQAQAWFEKAAEQNNAAAQNNLATLLLAQEPVDLTKINALYRAAAEASEADAQFNLGLGYAKGRGLPQDNALALKWYEKAAQQDHYAAIQNLANIYYHGQGVAQDYSKALHWFTKNAANGDAKSQFNLGVMYSKGQGTEQDLHTAREWYEKAAQQN